MAVTDEITIIVPIALGDDSWKKLLLDLEYFPGNPEFIFISPQGSHFEKSEEWTGFHSHRNSKWVFSVPGRANQLNAGAHAATKPFFWFLHADSRFSNSTYKALEWTMQNYKKGLYFYDLKFTKDGPPLMVLNEFGVSLRSRYLGLPFGDQGFFVSRDIFFTLEGYDSQLPYGEDHDFVLRAQKLGIPVLPIHGSLFTSARKYHLNGWGRTTIKTVWLTLKQAAPFFVDKVTSDFKKLLLNRTILKRNSKK